MKVIEAKDPFINVPYAQLKYYKWSVIESNVPTYVLNIFRPEQNISILNAGLCKVIAATACISLAFAAPANVKLSIFTSCHVPTRAASAIRYAQGLAQVSAAAICRSKCLGFWQAKRPTHSPRRLRLCCGSGTPCACLSSRCGNSKLAALRSAIYLG